VSTEPLVDATVIADLLAVPVTWVREQARAGTIPHYCLGRYKRFRVSEVLAWVEECRAGGRIAAFRGYSSKLDNSPRTAVTAGGVTPKE
jgi:excisionase family DNA binding protein